MGECPTPSGFAEQSPGVHAAVSGAINYLNANEELGSSISDEVADVIRQCLGEQEITACLDLGGMETVIFNTSFTAMAEEHKELP
eukprot:g15214.t1